MHKILSHEGHPKLAAFITHGGWNSILEATREGVPMIVIPLFADQFGNSKRVEKRGLGIGLDKFNLTERNIYNALNEILKNAKYGPKFVQRNLFYLF